MLNKSYTKIKSLINIKVSAVGFTNFIFINKNKIFIIKLNKLINYKLADDKLTF